MAFCKFSSEYVISNQTAVDNFFINEFLPSAPENCVKVYLYGLYKCSNPDSFDNTIEKFADFLHLTKQDIEDAFLYWQEQGLVQILFTMPLQIRFMPLKNVITNIKKFKLDKYSDFNLQAQQIIEGRMISSNEYAEYYTLLEAYHIQQEALIMIMQYCTELKGKNVGYGYILTVARNWATEGITTTEAVEERIKLLNQKTSGISDILKVCNIRRLATIDEQEKFIKWTERWDFKIDCIKYVAKQLAKKFGRTSIDKIDNKLGKYYELKKISISEIEEYEKQKVEMFALAKQITKTIGIYYEDLENVVETYVSKWLDLGHVKESLLTLANYCFKNSFRTMDSLDKLILKLYKLGIVNEEAINQYITDLIQEDKQIKEILESLGLFRNIISQDREFLKTWKYSWFIPKPLLKLAIEKATGKAQPMQYMNKILSTWHSKNIVTVEQANDFKFEGYYEKQPPKQSKAKIEKEDLSALFDSLDEIEI
ncbi:MAG: DnaD domain protein [Clostridia bacterium]|nr:DnaD domain protein [Clostridia bacterium]MDD4686399.1 DnaD domain protein [Clostridia bacterium]